jgi:hypothetical protein
MHIYIYIQWPPLWSSGQSSWLQIQRPGFGSRHYQIFWEVVGLEWGPLSFATTIEELLERNSSASGLENRNYGRGDPLSWLRDTLYTQKLTLASPTSDGRSVGIVRSRTQATEFFSVRTAYACTWTYVKKHKPGNTKSRHNFWNPRWNQNCVTSCKLFIWIIWKCVADSAALPRVQFPQQVALLTHLRGSRRENTAQWTAVSALPFPALYRATQRED